ncbi:hypothetical protein WJ966_00030 [Achromobacter xylosoxidans]
MVTALSFYGMSTFEGSMMSIRTVNAVALHRLDHRPRAPGALGWVAMISFGSLYYLIRACMAAKRCTASRPSNCTSGSPPSAWCCTSPRCGSPGCSRGLMWRDTAADGTLVYSFVEELKTRLPYYLIRLLGGTLFCRVSLSWRGTRVEDGERRASVNLHSARQSPPRGHRRRAGTV